MSRLETIGKSMDFAGGPVVMGILNVTPDSFSDGGRYVGVRQAVSHAGAMLEAGAAILDIGGESTRPGYVPVSMSEELSRVVPVVEELRRSFPAAVLSIDTSKAVVARAALAAGADILNDVSALEGDAEMWKVLRETGAACVLMHSKTLEKGEGIGEVRAYLERRLEWAMEKTCLRKEHFAFDPGIGFGKNLEQNLEVLRGIGSIQEAGCPVLLGVSRKSFIGQLTGRGVSERLPGTLSAISIGAYLGVEILRVHDVAEAVDALRVAQAIRAGEMSRI